MKGFIEIDGIEIKAESIQALEPTEDTSRFKARIYISSMYTFYTTKTVEQIKKLMCGGN